MYHPFSVGETIKTSWGVLKKNFTTLAVYSILSLFIYGIVDFLNKFVFLGNSIGSQLVIGLVQMIIQSYLALSFYKLILTLMDRQYYEFEFKEIWPSIPMAFRFIWVGLAYTLLVVILFVLNLQLEQYDAILAIIKIIEFVGIGYLLIRSIFCVCFIVDDDSGAIEALKQSFNITQNNFFNTLGIVMIILSFMIITLIPIVTLINMLRPASDSLNETPGYIYKLAFYLWFVIAFPTVQVLIMVTYRKLVYSHQDVDDDLSETD